MNRLAWASMIVIAVFFLWHLGAGTLGETLEDTIWTVRRLIGLY